MSNLLQKYLAKANEAVEHVTTTVIIDGDEWSVRKLNLLDSRACLKMAEKDGDFDALKYSDARIVKATEHAFPWNDKELLKAYKAKDKYDLPARLFKYNPEGYKALIRAVDELSKETLETEEEAIDELKN
ncbi:hypothetical protein [Brevibacillus brevis]|uniref:hypothetical protein n=1 Tax=Brevibacillus brevis TaxID=1393 RepID=UPI00165EB285|nr:hypothetical protein [Brevibacillus brevis]